ncbi:cache domain-containing protein [Agromyces sp. Marseille-Q5079]|uniref:cache domain-containing protein n=1 Tax=Agromyces sp. Marseille-Q5079 TaxID=3439059 RepID=UPI003D9C9F14
MPRSPHEVAITVGEVFAGVFDQLVAWRAPVEHVIDASPETRPAEIDQVVASLVLPRLTEPEPLLVGAGFIADGEIVRGRDVHFAWWLGPLDANPVLGSTTEPVRLDLTTRGYTEYLRDFRALEWYRIPATTRHAHVTGPYVDHLCTCDYILTLTMPVHATDAAGTAAHGETGEPRMVGVIGADVAVRRLERELLAAFLDVDVPLALVNDEGRVVLSTEPALEVGQLAPVPPADAVVEPCPGTPLRVLVNPLASGSN